MSWIWLLVCFASGLFVGYFICDVVTTEVKYTIGRMKNKNSPGADIGVVVKTPKEIRKELRNQRREARKNK